MLYVACVTLIPTLFTCVPVDCNALNDAPSPSSSSDGSNLGLPPVTTTAIHGVDVCARVGQSSIEVHAMIAHVTLSLMVVGYALRILWSVRLKENALLLQFYACNESYSLVFRFCAFFFLFWKVNTGVLVAYGCPKKEYNPSATLLLHSMDKTLKSLFARGFHYQYDCT